MKKSFFPVIVLLGAALMLASSCQKDINKPVAGTGIRSSATINHSNSGRENRIYVSSVAQLYAAVNDPDNTGAWIILAPGEYLLNSSYPNGGRLELQTDMSLRGQAGQPEAVRIDESALPAASFTIPAGRTGGIRTGKGSNTLEWLSLKGGAVAANPFSVLNADLLSAETEIRIAHVHVDANGSNIGINLRNRLAEHANRKIYASMEDNELTGAVNFNGIALALQNANGASGALIDLQMRNNYIHGNRVGILTFSTTGAASIAGCTILLSSTSDRIEGNGVGMDLTAGANQSTSTTSNNNTTTIEMHATSIRDNNPAGMPGLQPVNGALPGGIYAATAYDGVNNAAGYNRASGNNMTISLWGCDISNNNGTDIHAYAAWCPPVAVLAGMNNLLEIYLHGLSINATVDAVASSPPEPGGTNVVTVIRN